MQSSAFYACVWIGVNMLSFDISFFASVRITFPRNCRYSDNLLNSMHNNMANAVVYMSGAENGHVKSLSEN